MFKRRQLKSGRSFLIGAVVIFAALVLPSGSSETYGDFLRGVVTVVFPSSSHRQLEVERPSAKQIRIVVINPALMRSDGSGPVRNVDVPVSGFWTAIALAFALSVATPVRWKRRSILTLVSVGTMLLYELVTIGWAIWNESRHVQLSSLPTSAVWADNLQSLLTAQFNIALPILAWLIGLLCSQASVPRGVQPPSRQRPTKRLTPRDEAAIAR